ncbi:hypothetical protein QTP88_011851 [Uroleucon formosanum]
MGERCNMRVKIRSWWIISFFFTGDTDNNPTFLSGGRRNTPSPSASLASLFSPGPSTGTLHVAVKPRFRELLIIIRCCPVLSPASPGPGTITIETGDLRVGRITALGVEHRAVVVCRLRIRSPESV